MAQLIIKSEEDFNSRVRKYLERKKIPYLKGSINVPIRVNKESNSVENFDTSTYSWETLNSINENSVHILNKNKPNIFYQPHGSLLLGTKIFLSTRQSSSSKIICYPDYNNLNDYVISNAFEDNIESMVYDSNTDRIYLPITATQKIIIYNPNDYTYTTQTISFGSGYNLGNSTPILTDGTYLYCGIVNGSFNKVSRILISNFSVTSTADLGSTNAMHGAYLDIPNDTLYFTTVGSPRLYKLDTVAMTATYLTLPFAGFTDDMTYIPDYNDPINGDAYLAIASELTSGTTGTNRGALLINLTDFTTIITVDFLPSYCIKWDDVNKILYSLSFEGFIETIPNYYYSSYILGADVRNAISTYPIRFSSGEVFFVPNELILTPDNRIFITSFHLSVVFDLPNLIEVKLKKVINPVITRKELKYR